MADAIIIAIVLAAMAAAIAYIVKEKKRGVKCIGCSAAGTCGKKNGSESPCAGCGSVDEMMHQIKSEKK